MRALLLVCLLALAACRPAGLEPPVATDEPTPELTAIRVIVDWIIPGDEDLLAVADAIFLGEVTALSPTTFNQDSGAYYDGAMALHTVTFRVIEPIVDDVGLGPEVTLTVSAGSPADNGSVAVESGSVRHYQINVAHELAIGDEIVVVAGGREFVWLEGGTREVLSFADSPMWSYFARDELGNYSRRDSALPAMTYEALRAYLHEWWAANHETTPERVCLDLTLDAAVAGDADVLAQTEAAFLGEVTAISPTHFNQDSGQYYGGAEAIHTVTFRVIEPLVDEIGLGPEVSLTSLAGSPVDKGHVELEGADIDCYDVTVSHQFAVGQEMVVLARRSEIAWREGGTREVLAFAAWPTDAYFSGGSGQYRRNNSELPGMTLAELSEYIQEWRAGP